MAKILLHGTLQVTIYEAHQLFTVLDEFLSGIKEFLGDNEAGKLYATIDIEGARIGRTRLTENTDSNPKWDEQIRMYCAHVDSHVVFTLNQDEPIEPTILGRAYLPVTDILNGEELDTWLDILDDDHQPIHHDSKIHVKVQFFDVTTETPEFSGVPFTFFPERNQCRVTLYQDSHVPDNFLPEIPLAGGKYYEQHRCWEDIFDAINEARHLIYITGWSVYTKLTLVRDGNRPKHGGDMILGELLKKKAQQGVKVLMLVWEDVTGQMETHDDETAKYFEGSQVHCLLCPRNPDEGRNLIEKIGVTLVFTHHQKTLVVDSSVTNGRFDERRIVSFVGGIDLCDGRYDTQCHSLFRTLNSSHHEDFHQPNFEGSSIKKGGPREPWHDIHSRLEGPVAWDILRNFEQRWRKQGVKNDLLLDIQKMSEIFIPESPFTSPDDQETWNVQVFRSIDGGAVFGFPESPEEVAKAGLVSGKDTVIERSIQDAYIHAIRRAKRFIYIENQYFLGSSFNWKKSTYMNPADIGATHLIPKELSLKIVSKIEKGERFTVYVVVPMWPEGSPNSGPGQAMLDWQRRTMEMMYSDVTLTLRAKGIKANPKEYLSFFCLGNREVKKDGEYEPTEKPEPDSDYCRAQANRRFMIYVHSKMMIVDDEYIIIGSANINQRSMDGARDTEIAMGAYQPYHMSDEPNPARGQIHGFRMSLWYEHMGILDDVFLNPESEECVRKVNQIGNKYWDLYTCDQTLEEDDLPGHLLSYPIGVAEDGEVVELHGFEHFPDTKARILGTQNDLWPSIVTT